MPVIEPGIRVFWIGDRPPFDGAPSTMPGTVEEVLPDEWVFVRWIDKQGESTPEAVYESKWLQVVTEVEFARRRDEVRASSWPGLPHQPAPEAMPRHFAQDDFVRWAGPQPGEVEWDPAATRWIDDALGGGVTRSHPGVVVEADDNAAVRVRWADKDGFFEGRAFIRDDWLEPLSEQEFDRLTLQLRQSDWNGLRAK